jgi:succinyl-diaminopimelate desuccinylase
MNKKTLDLAQELIACPSITPLDAGCQALLTKRLQQVGFQITDISKDPVKNFWARYGTNGPLLIFAGHTDVVDPGPRDAWHTDPFAPTIKNHKLIGRGAQDMKGPLAAMIVAAEQFVQDYPQFPGSIGFAVTSAEEGDDYMNGTPLIVEHLQNTQQKVDWCVIGEPSCNQHFGDCIKNGRRGSLHAVLTIRGIQGHVAYPQLAENPIHKALPALLALQQTQWCDGGMYFPATSMQIVHIQAGQMNINNVIPAELKARINWRYSAELTAEQIKQQVEKILNTWQLNYTVEWQLSGEPFLTQAGSLTETLKNCINAITGRTPELSTGGGTSDGRFLSKLGCQTIEFGTCNDSIHKVNEQVEISELEQLTEIYYRVLKELFY